LRFAREGADVAVNYSRSQAEAEETAGRIRALGRKGMAVCADVSDDTAVRAMVERVAADLGGLDILVNNAGHTQFVPLGDLEGMTEEIWDRTFDVNVRGTFYCSRAAIPVMRRGGGGHIVSTASIAGYSGQGSSIAYAASKAAIISLTRSIAVSQAPDIRANAVAPGVVDTRWVADQPQFLQAGKEAAPLKRAATPDDVADAIYGLVITEYVTGQTLCVDGGRRI